MSGPGSRQRQRCEAAPAAAERSQDACTHACTESIEGRMPGEECPQLQSQAIARRREVAFELPLPPMAHHLGEGNAHGADAFATAAEGGGVGQLARFFHTE